MKILFTRSGRAAVSSLHVLNHQEVMKQTHEQEMCVLTSGTGCGLRCRQWDYPNSSVSVGCRTAGAQRCPETSQPPRCYICQIISAVQGLISDLVSSRLMLRDLFVDVCLLEWKYRIWASSYIQTVPRSVCCSHVQYYFAVNIDQNRRL